jgi:hypothetical protein
MPSWAGEDEKPDEAGPCGGVGLAPDPARPRAPVLTRRRGLARSFLTIP